jgi:hypothetical protein
MTRCTTIDQAGVSPPSARGSGAPAEAGGRRVHVFVWTLSFPLIKIALVGLPPLPLAAARFVAASPLILAWLACLTILGTLRRAANPLPHGC